MPLDPKKQESGSKQIIKKLSNVKKIFFSLILSPNCQIQRNFNLFCNYCCAKYQSKFSTFYKFLLIFPTKKFSEKFLNIDQSKTSRRVKSGSWIVEGEK
jgi:hypothetical protein